MNRTLLNAFTLVFGLVLLLPAVVGATPRDHAPSARTLLTSPVPRPPAITFRVEPAPGGSRWRWSLTNEGTSPVDLAADRRLVWVEAPTPAGAVAPPPAHGRVSALPTCIREDRPVRNDLVPRVTLAPGERYAELVDLRDLCRMRVPPSMSPGNIVTVHYGFGRPMARSARPTAVARPARTSASRSLVFAENNAVLEDLAVSAPTPPAASADPRPVTVTDPAAAPHAATPPLLLAAGSQGATGDALRVTVRLENPSVQPLWVVWRPGLLEFAVTTPDGRALSCAALTRASNPQRDLWGRIPPHGSRTMTVLPAQWCPRGAFDTAGVYQARVGYANQSDGHEYGFPRVLTGRVLADPFTLRVVRGSRQYVPLSPEFTGGDAEHRRP